MGHGGLSKRNFLTLRVSPPAHPETVRQASWVVVVGGSRRSLGAILGLSLGPLGALLGPSLLRRMLLHYALPRFPDQGNSPRHILWMGWRGFAKRQEC